MKNYLLKVDNILIIPKYTFQDDLTQYKGSRGHSATSDDHWQKVLACRLFGATRGWWQHIQWSSQLG
jgi:hypothetical protein